MSSLLYEWQVGCLSCGKEVVEKKEDQKSFQHMLENERVNSFQHMLETGNARTQQPSFTEQNETQESFQHKLENERVHTNFMLLPIDPQAFWPALREKVGPERFQLIRQAEAAFLAKECLS